MSDPVSPMYANAAATSPDCQSPIQQPNVIKGNALPVVPSSPDHDRGRFPAQRRRRGGTKSYPGRQSDTPASVMITPHPPPIIQASNPPFSRKEPLGNVGNLLPSPSPSVETRRPSCNIVDLEDEVTDPTAAGAELRTRLEELVAQHGGIEAVEKKLQESNDTSTLSTSNAAAPALSTEAERLDSATAVSNAERSRLAEDHSVSSQSAQAKKRVISFTQKRPSENLLQPRKRVQNTSEIQAAQDHQRQLSNHSIQDASNAKSVVGPEMRGTQAAQNHQREFSSYSVQDISNSSSLMETEVRGFLEKVLRRSAFLDAQNRPANNIERSRLDLLRDACERMDWFYLCLHQFYCLEHVRKSGGGAISFPNDNCRDGLSHLSYLLVHNDKLDGVAVRWFSEFPLPMEVLYPGRPIFRAAYEKVLICLAKFSVNWTPFRDACLLRGYPPLVDELTEVFGAESYILQYVIFRALLRDFWKGPQDQCFQHVENMFPRSYQEALHRRMTSASSDVIKAQNQVFVHEYQQLSQLHQRHTSSQQDQPRQRLVSNAASIQNQTNERRDSGITQISGDHGAQFSPHQNNNGSIPVPQRLAYLQRPIMPLVPPANQDGNQSLAAREQTTSRLPSELVGQLAHSGVQGLQTRHILPSNIVSPQPNSLQQMGRGRPQRPPRVQTFPLYVPTNPPSQQGPPHEMQGPRLENFHGHHVPLSLPTHFIRADPNLNRSQPNPALVALHQAHLRSPTLNPAPRQGSEKHKLLRYIERVLLPSGELSNFKRHLSWDFHIDKETADRLVKDIPGSYGSPPSRTLLPGSRLCRIRCIKINEAVGLPNQNEWVAAENIWPAHTAVLLNDEALQMRKKSHHGKDLPIDATAIIKEGKNNISTAIIGLPENCSSRYAIGVEIIAVIEEQAIKDQIRIIPYSEARQRILAQTKTTDPEVQVVDSQITLDLTDPFTARIFDVPIRGTSCRHNQCFDRDVFLQTRDSKNPKEPCPPDEFRCPICGLDARPQSLAIDYFFVSIREELHKKGRLDVKAVILHLSGEWEIKEEEEVTGEQGDGSGVRCVQARSRRSVGRQSTPRDVIELDD